MKRLSKRERYLIIATFIFTIGALFVYYIYFPLQDEIKDLQEKSNNLSLEIDEAKIRKSLVEQAKEEIKVLEEKSSEYEEYLMDSIEEPILLAYIDGIVSNRSIMQTLIYNPIEDLELYVNKDIDLSFKTDYRNLCRILEEFEEGEYYSTLNNLEVTYEKDAEATMPLKVNYSIRFYGADGTWDGQGEYDFMRMGRFRKSNLFN